MKSISKTFFPQEKKETQTLIQLWPDDSALFFTTIMQQQSQLSLMPEKSFSHFLPLCSKTNVLAARKPNAANEPFNIISPLDFSGKPVKIVLLNTREQLPEQKKKRAFAVVILNNERKEE